MNNKKKRSGKIAFAPRARLLKLIGEELISDEVVAISELVKNSYDADASAVQIIFNSVAEGEGTIIVQDDGCGMDLDTLLGCWMQPAGSLKGRTNTRSPKGRRLLGEKGVGRFAADKIGRSLQLTTEKHGSSTQVVASYEWDQFDDDSLMLADIKCRWQEFHGRAPKKSHGTELKMSGLRSNWNERMFRRMCARLGRLLSPFRDRDGFRITIESDDFPDYSGELRQDILDAAPYRIDAVYDGQSVIELKIDGNRAVSYPWNGEGALQCGPVRLRLFAFDLESDAISKLGPNMEVRAWLKEWSGISIYRDAFRLWPYGEHHDDWLRLDQRRVNNPVVRLSNNQIVGFIDISRQDNPDLVDQTNREGLVNNRALEDLRRLSLFVLQAIEAERQRYRRGDLSEQRRNGVKNGGAGSSSNGASGERPTNGAARSGKEDVRLNQLLEGYSELAAVGTAAADVGEAVSIMLKDLRASCAEIRQQVSGEGSREIRGKLGAVDELASQIESRVNLIEPLERNGPRRSRTIDVNAEALSFRHYMSPILDARGMRLDVHLWEQCLVRIRVNPENFHRILYILCANSQDWLFGIDKPTIRIANAVNDGVYEMTFSDNGPGIPLENAESIFEPRFTRKEKGRGMGLTIASKIVAHNNGTIELIKDRRRRGANLRICFPLTRTPTRRD